MTEVGLLHPGEMGASVGAAARGSRARVRWASAGRSAATRARAERAALEDAGDEAALLAASDVVIAVCPPDAALELARRVASAGFGGIYVDANAVSPDTARSIASAVEAGGARFVDGGLVGPPAHRPGTTWLWLSGDAADEVARLFDGGPLAARTLKGGAGAASALKMAFAAWTKGSSALLLAVRALAAREGVEEALLAQWQHGLPDLAARSEGTARGTAPKAWRFVGEMHEIADSFAAAGLPDGFHRAAAELYRRMAAYKDADTPPELAAVIETLLRDGGDHDS